jgi:hypothetical protein
MATNFPDSLDTFINPQDGTILNDLALNHADVHADAFDAIEAIQTKVGYDNSNVTSSIDYILNQVKAEVVKKTQADWDADDVILKATQIGVELDTLKFKFGTGNLWSVTQYATVTPPELADSLTDYLEVSLRGNPDGVASLGSDGKIPDTEIPSGITRDTELSAHASLTTTHGVSGALVGTSDSQTLTNKNIVSPTGLVKADVGLGNVNNTSDANKPISTATQSALDLKANLDAPTFTGTVNAANITVSGNLNVSGTTTTVNSANLNITDPMIYMGDGNDANVSDLGIVSAFDDGTYQHTGLVRDASEGKWKLFKGVTDEPTTTVNFGQGSLDALAVGALEASSAAIGDVTNTEIQYLEGVTSSIQSQIDSKSDNLIQYVTETGTSVDLSASHLYKIVEFTASTAISLVIPNDPTDSTFPIGSSIELRQAGDGEITVSKGNVAITLDAPENAFKTRVKWSSAILEKRASNSWLMTGDTEA